MITIQLDPMHGPEVARVEIVPPSLPQPFTGTIATRAIADFLSTHIGHVTGQAVDGWVNLLDTPAGTAWKVNGQGQLQALTVIPPRDVVMKAVRPFLSNYDIRPYTEDEVMDLACHIGPCVWSGTWDAAGTLHHTAFALVPDGVRGNFLDTPCRNFPWGNVYETGKLCWGNTQPIAPRGNLFALDQLFWKSVNNFHIMYPPVQQWWHHFYGLAAQDRESWRPLTRLTKPQALTLVTIPERVELAPGTTSFRLAQLLSNG